MAGQESVTPRVILTSPDNDNIRTLLNPSVIKKSHIFPKFGFSVGIWAFLFVIIFAAIMYAEKHLAHNINFENVPVMSLLLRFLVCYPKATS